jgi:hypothetical protein
MTAKQDMKKLVEEIYAVRDRGDVEGTLTLIGDDCTFRMVGNTRLAPFSTEASGNAFRQAITQLITAWVYPTSGQPASMSTRTRI